MHLYYFFVLMFVFSVKVLSFKNNRQAHRVFQRGIRTPRAPIRPRNEIKSQLSQKLFGFGFAFGETEKDPGAVKGTKLRILKYPHPQLRQVKT
jgi:hypothetical protein